MISTLLLIASAFLHAAWNSFARKISPSRDFYLRAEVSMALLTLPGWFWLPRILAGLHPREILLIAVTTLCQALYYDGLARLYRRGDLSWSYPLLRTGPVVLLAALLLPFGTLRPLPLLGSVLLALLGMWGVSKRHDSRAHNAHPWGSMALSILAVSGYTLCDTVLSPAFARAGLGVPLTTLCLVTLFSTGNALWLSLLPREALRSGSWRAPALASLGIWGSYALVLAAMTTPLPPHLVALFRLLGIPFTLLLARLTLGERISRRRCWGALALAAAAALGKYASPG